MVCITLSLRGEHIWEEGDREETQNLKMFDVLTTEELIQ
jgi:hypothetical protein